MFARSAPIASLTGAHGSDDGLGNCFDVFVLPVAEHCPAVLAEDRVGFAVSFDVSLQFREPVVPVSFRDCRVLWAPVPETPVNEDRDLLASEHDVCAASSAERRVVDSIPEACLVQQPSHGDFGGGVSPPI